MVRQMSLQNMQTSSMKYKRTNQNERGKEKESTEKNFNVVTNEEKKKKPREILLWSVKEHTDDTTQT